MTAETFSYCDKVLIYVMGTLKELQVAELIEGPTLLTEPGEIAFEELRRVGFTPTADEIQDATRTIVAFIK